MASVEVPEAITAAARLGRDADSLAERLHTLHRASGDGDLDRLRGLFCDSAVLLVPSRPPVIGLDRIGDFFAEYWRRYPTRTERIHQILVDGFRVLAFISLDLEDVREEWHRVELVAIASFAAERIMQYRLIFDSAEIPSGLA